jgi:putative ABC transport system permease protein
MSSLMLAGRNLIRRPVRTVLAVAGLACALATLAVLSSLGTGYERELRVELDRSGLELMLVPLGCPYDAAARVFKGQVLDSTLPEDVLGVVRRDPAVAAAAPLLLSSQVRAQDGRTDLWAGIDPSVQAIKPWWRVQHGAKWFTADDQVILGAESAASELRAPGDLLYSPEANRSFRVVGVLESSGTSDDHLFFLPLRTAQSVFGQTGRLTAVAIRLRDPGLLSEAARRLQAIPGAQVVTVTEVMGVFQNMLGAGRTLLAAVSAVALAVGLLTVLNTMLAAVMERSGELALFRALGASRWQVFRLIAFESGLLVGAALIIGLAGAASSGVWLEGWVRPWIPLAPDHLLGTLEWGPVLRCAGVGLVAGAIATLYPAIQAVRIPPAEASRPT